MVLTNKDTINGMPIQSWLNKQEDLPAQPITNPEDKHALYNQPRVRYPVQKGRSGKVKHLTRNQIIKEYGEKPMTNSEKIIKALYVRLREGTAYTAPQIYEWVKLAMTYKNFSPLMSTIFLALEAEGFMDRDSSQKPPLYSMSGSFYQYRPAINELTKIVKKRTNKKQRERLQKKSEIKPSVVNAKPIAEAIKKNQKQITEKIKESMQNAIAVPEVTHTIPAVPEKIKVQIELKVLFGFIK